MKIRYSAHVLFELQELFDTLIRKEYFSSYEQADAYVTKLIKHIDKNIASLPKSKAPSVFNSYGTNLQYVFYRKSPYTTWYILFEQHEDSFLIKHITNNHASGHHFNCD